VAVFCKNKAKNKQAKTFFIGCEGLVNFLCELNQFAPCLK
jgi:hypothetical protein